MDVVEVELVRDFAGDALPQLGRSGNRGTPAAPAGRSRRSRSARMSRPAATRADQQRGGAAHVRQRHRRKAARRSGRRRQIDAAQQLAGAGRSRCCPVTNSTRHVALAAVARPDGADAFQRGGQRDHRAGRQRHADVAADGGRVPDLERSEEGAAALADQRRGRPFRRARGVSSAIVQVAAMGSPRSSTSSAGQPRLARSTSRRSAAAARRRARCRRQPGSPSRHSRQRVAAARPDHVFDRVQVHNVTSGRSRRWRLQD